MNLLFHTILYKMQNDDLFPDIEIPQEIVNATKKTLVSYIPIVGNAITNIWNEFESAQLQRKIERLESLITGLCIDLKRLETRINKEYINKQDCADILEKAAYAVAIERLEEKREAYKNILLNSIVSDKADFDRTEKYMQLLSQMTRIDIILVKTFHNPQEINKQRGNPIKNPFIDENGNRLPAYQRDYLLHDILYGLLKLDKEDIADSIDFLYQNRLINKDSYKLSTNGHPIHTLDGMLTEKGKGFVDFILTP